MIVFRVQRLGKGTYGTALNAPLPKAMDAWGRLTGLEMTLSRRYRHKGKRRSFISAGCPAPRGFPGAVFPLARTSFAFAGGKEAHLGLHQHLQGEGMKKVTPSPAMAERFGPKALPATPGPLSDHRESAAVRQPSHSGS